MRKCRQLPLPTLDMNDFISNAPVIVIEGVPCYVQQVEIRAGNLGWVITFMPDLPRRN